MREIRLTSSAFILMKFQILDSRSHSSTMKERRRNFHEREEKTHKHHAEDDCEFQISNCRFNISVYRYHHIPRFMSEFSSILTEKRNKKRKYGNAKIALPFSLCFHHSFGPNLFYFCSLFSFFKQRAKRGYPLEKRNNRRLKMFTF